MVSAHYLVKELMDWDHMLHTYYCKQYLAWDTTVFIHSSTIYSGFLVSAIPPTVFWPIILKLHMF